MKLPAGAYRTLDASLSLDEPQLLKEIVGPRPWGRHIRWRRVDAASDMEEFRRESVGTTAKWEHQYRLERGLYV